MYYCVRRALWGQSSSTRPTVCPEEVLLKSSDKEKNSTMLKVFALSLLFSLSVTLFFGLLYCCRWSLMLPSRQACLHNTLASCDARCSPHMCNESWAVAGSRWCMAYVAGPFQTPADMKLSDRNFARPGQIKIWLSIDCVWNQTKLNICFKSISSLKQSLLIKCSGSNWSPVHQCSVV